MHVMRTHISLFAYLYLILRCTFFSHFPRTGHSLRGWSRKIHRVWDDRSLHLTSIAFASIIRHLRQPSGTTVSDHPRCRWLGRQRRTASRSGLAICCANRTYTTRIRAQLANDSWPTALVWRRHRSETGSRIVDRGTALRPLRTGAVWLLLYTTNRNVGLLGL